MVSFVTSSPSGRISHQSLPLTCGESEQSMAVPESERLTPIRIPRMPCLLAVGWALPEQVSNALLKEWEGTILEHECVSYCYITCSSSMSVTWQPARALKSHTVFLQAKMVGWFGGSKGNEENPFWQGKIGWYSDKRETAAFSGLEQGVAGMFFQKQKPQRMLFHCLLSPTGNCLAGWSRQLTGGGKQWPLRHQKYPISTICFALSCNSGSNRTQKRTPTKSGLKTKQ